MADDIEVTPEMIEEARRVFARYAKKDLFSAEFVTEIHRAMARKAAEQGVDGARRRLIGYNGDAPIYGDPL